MEIKLKKLTLHNFMGIKKFEFIPEGENATVYGQNASGKTTLMHAFIYLLFGKNADGAADFNIKTLDQNNQPIHKLDHEVEAVLIVDGMETTLKKVFKEKWVKRRGEEQHEFSGHETAYFWNEVPQAEKDYKARISGLCDEAIFKMITNPLAFNALKWTERRAILFDIAGKVDDADIFRTITTKANADEMTNLALMLNNGKSFEDYKRQVALQKKRMREQLDQIPIRINELERSMPGLPDVETIKESIWAKNLKIESLDTQISDIAKANEAANQKKIEKQNQIHALKSQLLNLENEADLRSREKTGELTIQIRGLEADVRNLNSTITKNNGYIADAQKQITYTEKQIRDMEADLQDLRNHYNAINADQLVVDNNKFICPSCKRLLPPGEIDRQREELTANFNRDKVKSLERIQAEGKAKKNDLETRKEQIVKLNQMIAAYQDEIETTSQTLADLNAKIAELQLEASQPQTSKEDILASNGDCRAIKAKIQEIENNTDDLIVLDPNIEDGPEVVIQRLKDQRNTLQSEITNLTVELKKKDQIDSIYTRIADLEDEARMLGAEIAKLEKTEFAIEQFTRAKIDLIEERINGKFKLARFKMFNLLINGGVEETCETTYKGVPWQDMNGAARVQVGLDIINTLSDHCRVIAPIFIDNRESCTEIPEVSAQIINLVVSEKDKTLRVKIEKLEKVNV